MDGVQNKLYDEHVAAGELHCAREHLDGVQNKLYDEHVAASELQFHDFCNELMHTELAELSKFPYSASIPTGGLHHHGGDFF